MARGEGGDRPCEGIDLAGGAPDERGGIGQDGAQGLLVEREARVAREAGEEIVFPAFPAAQSPERRDRMLLDDMVGGPALTASMRMVVVARKGSIVGFPWRSSRVGFHLVQDDHPGFEEAVDGEEGVGQGDAATTEQETSPSFHWSPARPGHGEVTFEDGVEAVDALAAAAVHLVRHGGGADLALAKPSPANSWPAMRRRVRRSWRAGGELEEGGDDLEIEAARIDLADGREGAGKPRWEDAVDPVGDLGGIAVEEGELIELGAHRALEAAHGIAR
jgi:hypothetical protein